MYECNYIEAAPMCPHVTRAVTVLTCMRRTSNPGQLCLKVAAYYGRTEFVHGQPTRSAGHCCNVNKVKYVS